jgi:hypothetical protein
MAGSKFEPTIPNTIGVNLPQLPHKPGISYEMDGHSGDQHRNSDLQKALVARPTTCRERHFGDSMQEMGAFAPPVDVTLPSWHCAEP